MKKLFFVLVLILTTQLVFCNEVQNVFTYNFGLSLGIANGCTIGMGKIQQFEKKTKEINYNVHYIMNSNYYVTGLYTQINSFRNIQRKGFFTLIAGGLDYTKGKHKLMGSIGGSSEEDDEYIKFEGIFPNIVIGCGYSIRLNKDNRMLIGLDFGIKRTISNLSIVIYF